MEVIPKHSIRTEWKKKATADRSGITVEYLIWRLFDTFVLTSGFNRESQESIDQFSAGGFPMCADNC